MILDSDTASASPQFSIVIPAFEEEAIIETSFEKVRNYLEEQNVLDSTEIVVVVADSKDATAQIAKDASAGFKFFQLIEPGKKHGKGRDVRIGMLAARGEFILFTDADLATPAHHIMPMFDKLKSDSEVVIGIRDLKKIHHGYRSLLSRCTNLLTRMIILPGISDTQCGFKGFRSQCAHEIFSVASIDGWSFDIEVLALARKLKKSIGTVEINDWFDPKLESGLIGENPIKTISRSLIELFIIRMRFWTRYYERKINA